MGAKVQPPREAGRWWGGDGGVFAGLKGGLRKQKDRVRKWKEHRDTQEECGVGTETRAREKAFMQVGRTRSALLPTHSGQQPDMLDSP